MISRESLDCTISWFWLNHARKELPQRGIVICAGGLIIYPARVDSSSSSRALEMLALRPFPKKNWKSLYGWEQGSKRTRDDEKERSIRTSHPLAKWLRSSWTTNSSQASSAYSLAKPLYFFLPHSLPHFSSLPLLTSYIYIPWQFLYISVESRTLSCLPRHP